MVDKYQQKLADELKTTEGYSEASVYTIVLALVQDSSVEEVYFMLHNVAWDIDELAQLEQVQQKAEDWQW